MMRYDVLCVSQTVFCKEPSGSGTPAAKYNWRMAGSLGTCGLRTVRAKTDTKRRKAQECALHTEPSGAQVKQGLSNTAT